MHLVTALTQVQLLLIPVEASTAIREHLRQSKSQDMEKRIFKGSELRKQGMRDQFTKVDKVTETHFILRDMPDGTITLELRTDPERDIQNRLDRGEDVAATICESFAYAALRVLIQGEAQHISEVTMPGLGTVRPTIYKGHAVLGEMSSEMKQAIDKAESDVTSNTTPDRKKMH